MTDSTLPSLTREPLGRTGMEVSRVGFGTGSIGGFYGEMDDKRAAEIVERVLELGINYIDTSTYYGEAERRLGKALAGHRDDIYLATKAGRYGDDDFDFSPNALRASLERSLGLLHTDYVDVFMLHDIEFVPQEEIFAESLDTLRALKSEGKCRAIGISGYPMKTMSRAVSEAEVDVVLTYAHGTLLDDSITSTLGPLADEHGVGLINAASLVMGLLTPNGARADSAHRASAEAKRAAERMSQICRVHGADLAFVANQYSIQQSGCVMTMIGAGSERHIEEAIVAASTPIDEALLTELLAVRPPVESRQWLSGLEENN
ncbi:aldo/keto reductase [Tessaracoccus sp.]|uniref:aldo/keto reductase n=1 Tax=Tessaracoccus sp. TaxID=1971211 RepID=UPI0026137DB2|nr:aldo/keto reductase [Tessaracoccus sp.]